MTKAELVDAVAKSAKISKVAAGIDGARIHGTPQYIDMLRYVCERRNWRLDDFDVYRMRMDYPLMDTMVAMRFNVLPD